jgi:LPS-assembly protein
VIADNKDLTIRPTIFDKDVKMFQNEYRQINKNSSLTLDFAYIDNYKSSLSNKKNSISHLFAQFDADLALDNFTNSNFFISIQKVTNDTYLKIFDGNLFKNKLTPDNYDVLNSKAKLTLNNDKYDFTAGFESYENLQLISSDRYQYILPYYSLDKQIFSEFDKGFINFTSFGSNDLNNTNNLKTKVINDINFQSLDLLTDYGFKNNYNIYMKNLNTSAKNDAQYKSSPQVELMSIFEFNSSLPLINETENSINYLTPKVSFRFNPGDMKNYSDTDRKISVSNIFDINRLGIDDSFEEGKSLTMGLDFKKTNILDINKFFEAKLATVYREKDRNFIPSSSGIDKENSNFFGSISSNFSEFLNVSYDFIIDNDFNTLKYNSLNTTLNFNNLSTEFNFIEENGEFGDANTIENKTKLKFNDDNFLTFNSRRNRKISLTEYYDLIYEYKNDCLVAGIKYNKTYYEDRDLKPSENLLFTITLSPLTSFEQKVDK